MDMICFPKPALIKDLYILQKEVFPIICYMCDILSSERMLHKDYDRKGPIDKKKREREREED
jgi:hypothetical protein